MNHIYNKKYILIRKYNPDSQKLERSQIEPGKKLTTMETKETRTNKQRKDKQNNR